MKKEHKYLYIGKVIKGESERLRLEVIFDDQKVALEEGDTFVTFYTSVPLEEYLL
jgi:hypothetical protein